jgi:sugar O-acyltransferase (sialic acid O-acetyltransferase NeuD family)
MKEIIIIGGGGHAKVVISILKKIGKYKIIGYTDIKNQGPILGIEYIGTDEEIINYNVSMAVIGIGVLENFKIRYEIINNYIKKRFLFPSIISPYAVVNEGVSIGEGTVLMDGAIVNSGTSIGNFSIINTRSSVDHDCRIGDFVHIAPGVTLSGGVQIGNSSLIGIGSTVVQYKTIAENCIIGAGTVITKDCLESGKYAGIPMKRIDE